MSFIIGILLGGVVVIFALQNTAPVMVSFLGWGFQGSVAFIVIVSLFIGILISLLFSLSSFISGMMSESRLRKHNEALKKELDDHKVMLAEAHEQIAQKSVDTIVVVPADTTIL